jgi:hypothetical protein
VEGIRTYFILYHTIEIARCTVRDQDEIVDPSLRFRTRKTVDDRLNDLGQFTLGD